MNEDVEYDDDALEEVAMACRRFVEDVERLPPAAVALMLPALRSHLEDRLALALMSQRSALLGRNLTPEECEEEAEFVCEELIRSEAEAEERMPDLLFMLRVDTLRVPEPGPVELSPEQREEIFNGIVEKKESLDTAIRASQDFWSEMVVDGVNVDTRLLIIYHLVGICTSQLVRRECRKARREERVLTDERMHDAVLTAMSRRHAIDILAREKKDEIFEMAKELGASGNADGTGERVAGMPELRYIA